MVAKVTTALMTITVVLLASTLPALAGWQEDYRSARNAGNQRRALQVVEDASRRGDVEAEFTMGLIYHAGQLVRRDDEKGYAWMLVAIEHGFQQGRSSAAHLEKKLSQGQRDRAKGIAADIRSGRVR